MRTNCGLRTTSQAIIVAAATAAVAACSSARRPSERPVPTPVAAVVLTPEPDEYAVYSAILRPRFGELVVADSTLENAPLYCLDGNKQLRPECIRRDSSRAAVEMWRNYAARNARRAVVLKRFASDLRITLRRDWKESPRSGCAGATTIEFSRIGFDRARRFALVTVKTTQAPGPYPGCGFASSTTVVYERSRSGWKVRYFIGGSII